MRRRTVAVAASVLGMLWLPSSARAQGSPTAVDELKTGFELRTQGKCDEAIPHLLESVRLGGGLKALINLADCEGKVGKLLDARKHWRQTRDQAVQEGKTPFQKKAEQELDALEKLIPQLTVKLVPDAPAGTSVELDGSGIVEMLGTPIAVDPREHTVLVATKGYVGKLFKVTLAEKEHREVVVYPGTKVPEPEPAVLATPARSDVVEPEANLSQASTVPPPPATPNIPTSFGALRTLGVVATGLGAVGLGLGTAFGVNAINKQRDAHCPGNVCTSLQDGQTLIDAAWSGNASTALFIVGGAVAAGGVTMLLVAPKSAGVPRTGVQVTGGMGGAGMALRGAF
jgi:hypothetical protein